MVNSGFSSALIGDRNQHWNINGYDGCNADTANYMSSANASKSAKKGNYNAPTAPPATTGYPSDFQSDDIVPSYTPNNTNTTNSMHKMNNTKVAKNGKKVNFQSPTEALEMASYPSSFRSRDIDSPSRPNTINTTSNTNKMNYMNTGKNMTTKQTGNESSYNRQSRVPPAIARYPGAFKPSEDDSSFADDTDTLYNSNRMNNINTTNTLRATKNGKKDNYYQATAAPPSATYSSAFQSGETDSISTHNANSMYSMNDINNLNTRHTGKKGNYHPSTAAQATTAYPSAFEPDGIGSSFTNNTDTMHNTNNTNHANTTNSGSTGKVNYHQPTRPPVRAAYSGPHQSSRMDSNSTPSTDTIYNMSSVNNANNINTAKNIKTKSNYQHSAAPPEIVAYPSAVPSSKIGSMSTSNNVNTAKAGKTGSYNSQTGRPATPSYPSALQPSEVDVNSGLIAAAWEEHIDAASNTMYFYNNITRTSTWGPPSGMVKRVPPPPRSPPPNAPIVQKREQDQWFRIRDRNGWKIWYNEITRRSQVERPDCLRKYM